MRPSRNQPSALHILPRVSRSQPQRVLCQLRRNRARAALRRRPRSLVEHLGHRAVRNLRRQREMPRPDERVVDDLGDPAVDNPPAVGQVCIEH